MTISAAEIETKAFLVSLRGYDRAEVDRWLQDLAEEHRRLVAELEASEHDGGLLDLREHNDVFTAVGREVADVLRAAREAAAAMFERALEDVENQRRSMLEQASEDIAQQKAQMLEEVADAKAATARAIDRIRTALVDDLLRDSDER